MTNAFDSIKQGLTEAVAHAKSKGVKPAGVKLYQPHAVDVSSLRERERHPRPTYPATDGTSAGESDCLLSCTTG